MVTAISRRDFLVGAALAALATSAHAQTLRRIITLEWAETEIALSLGAVPIGVADLAGYRQWVGIENARLSEAVDVGGRQQPSLEALMRLKPDLILTSALRHGAIASRLEEIAPTVLLDAGSDKSDFYEAMRSGLLTSGKALGKEAEARAEWQSFENRLATSKGGRSEAPKVVIAQPLPGVARLRVFTSNSTVMGTLAKAGFAEGIERGAHSFGFTTFGLEDLATLGADTHLFLTGDAVPQELTQGALWPVLPIGANKKIHTLGADIWPFGSTRSMLRLLDRVTHILPA